MAKHGPQRYPGASTRYWFQSRYGGDAMESNVIVWHTTEGTSVPSYSGGAVAPNFTATPDFAAKRLRWYQHFDFDTSSRALENDRGGVETNTMNACQVELVGTCDPATHKRWGRTPHLYAADLPDWAVRDLAAFARWAHDHHGVKLRSGLTFRPYPSSYGATSTRLTGREWLNFYGHCGHQHVPENVHGDPGAFPMDAILAAAKGSTPISASKEDDMQLDMSQLVPVGDWIAEGWPHAKGDDPHTITLHTALGSGYGHARRAGDASEAALAELKQLRAERAADRAILDKLAEAVGKAGNFDVADLKREIRAAAAEAVESIEATVTIDVPDAPKEQ